MREIGLLPQLNLQILTLGALDADARYSLVPEGGLRYTDVWQSEEHWNRFVEDRLHPVVHGLLHEIFGDDLPPEPELNPLSVIHVWQPGTD